MKTRVIIVVLFALLVALILTNKASAQEVTIETKPEVSIESEQLTMTYEKIAFHYEGDLYEYVGTTLCIYTKGMETKCMIPNVLVTQKGVYIDTESRVFLLKWME